MGWSWSDNPISSAVDSVGKTASNSWNDVTHAATHSGDIDFFTGTFGSQNSVLQQTNPGNWLMGPNGATSGLTNGQSAWQYVTSGQKAQIQTPGAAPTLAGANQTALQGELQQEKNMRSTWGMLTGSGGVLDTPTTNSQRLLGN